MRACYALRGTELAYGTVRCYEYPPTLRGGAGNSGNQRVHNPQRLGGAVDWWLLSSLTSGNQRVHNPRRENATLHVPQRLCGLGPRTPGPVATCPKTVPATGSSILPTTTTSQRHLIYGLLPVT
eukprot:828254-Rhodomonas_salina.1